MAFVGKVGAKLLLFGEHAVVHGYPAIGTAIPGEISASWSPGSPPLHIEAPATYVDAVRLAFRRAAITMGIDPEELGGTLVIEGAIPPESGFGSSGALCGALARSLAARQAELGHPVHEDIVWTAANEAERLFHGNPSGVDTGLSLRGGLLMVEPGASFPPAAHSLPHAGVHVVYGSVPRDSSCAANVAAIGKAMRSGDTRVSTVIRELGSIAARAGTLLAASLSDPKMLGVLASEAMGLLSRLGLSTPALDALVADGMSAGALGGKLSGGGGGGAFWLACPDADTAAAVQESVIAGARRLRLPGDAWVGRIVI